MFLCTHIATRFTVNIRKAFHNIFHCIAMLDILARRNCRLNIIINRVGTVDLTVLVATNIINSRSQSPLIYRTSRKVTNCISKINRILRHFAIIIYTLSFYLTVFTQEATLDIFITIFINFYTVGVIVFTSMLMNENIFRLVRICHRKSLNTRLVKFTRTIFKLFTNLSFIMNNIRLFKHRTKDHTAHKASCFTNTNNRSTVFVIAFNTLQIFSMHPICFCADCVTHISFDIKLSNSNIFHLWETRFFTLSLLVFV